MPTTIQIDDNIKNKLFKIKLKLEEQKGSAMTYNEIIEFLIKNQKFNLIKKKDLKEFRCFEGILPESALEEYLKEKEKELEREESRASLKRK